MTHRRNSYLIGKAFRSFLMASVLSVAAEQVAVLVDAAVVGRLVSAEALAGVSIIQPLIQALFSLSVLFVVGGTMLTGVSIGNGERDKANSIFSVTLACVVTLGVAFVIGAFSFYDQILSFLCPSPTLRPFAGQYANFILLGSPFYLLSYMLQCMVTVDGHPRLVTVSVVVGNIVNLVLNIVLIKVFNTGVAGAAAATVTMNVLNVVILSTHFMKKGTLSVVIPRKVKEIVTMLLKNGLPEFVATSLIAVQMAAGVRIASIYMGDAGVVVLAVCSQLFSFSMIFLSGTLNTLQPMSAILKGANDSKGMLILLRQAYTFLFICLAVYTLAICLAPTQIAAFFGVSTELQMQMALQALPLYSLHIVMQSLFYQFITIYQIHDHPRFAIYLSTGQSIFPAVGFALLAFAGGPLSPWWGFFLGQAFTVLSLLPFVVREQRRNRTLTPIFLIKQNDESVTYDVSVATNYDALHEMQTEMADFMQGARLGEKAALNAVLCTEELVKNIIDHGHAHSVDVRATHSDDGINISLCDDGKLFNPVEYDKETGLGLQIVRGLATAISYDTIFNQNVVTITIKK